MNMFPRIYKFHFFCRKILPLVYDDSLSYYEFLCKLNQKIEEVIDTVNEHSGAIEEIMNELENVITEDRLVQTGGTSETDVMSQKAVTDAIENAVNTNWAEPVDMQNKTFVGKDTVNAGYRTLNCPEFTGLNGSDYDQITWDGSDLTYHLSNGGTRVSYNRIIGWNSQ